MAGNVIDEATFEKLARLLASESDDFAALVRLAGLDPARDLRHTDMSGTSMADADLRGFDFTGADFRSVNLDRARLDGACFKGADLSGTDFSKARGLGAADCSFAVFQDAPFAPEMVVLPADSFLMGSPYEESGSSDNERPQRSVSIEAFAIGRYPVTFEQYDRYCDDIDPKKKVHDIGWGRGRRPVISVTWSDARAYVEWLAKVSGREYRLPSEAEWEYACRAGTSTAFWWGNEFDQEQVNTSQSGRGQTAEVDCYPANPWGIYDISGNIREWVDDSWHNNFSGAPNSARAWVEEIVDNNRYRVLRSASFLSDQNSARCASRLRKYPNDRNNDIGFRVACFLHL